MSGSLLLLLGFLLTEGVDGVGKKVDSPALIDITKMPSTTVITAPQILIEKIPILSVEKSAVLVSELRRGRIRIEV